MVVCGPKRINGARKVLISNTRTIVEYGNPLFIKTKPCAMTRYLTTGLPQRREVQETGFPFDIFAFLELLTEAVALVQQAQHYPKIKFPNTR